MKEGIEQRRPIKGILPTVKSWIWGDNTLDPMTYRGGGITTQTFWQFIGGTHQFNTAGLKYLVDTGYKTNSVGFGIVSKILLSQRNIKFEPYWKGKPYVSKQINFDLNYALQNLITTGTCIIYKWEVVGFSDKEEVLDTLRVCEEVDRNGEFKYTYLIKNGQYVKLDPSRMCRIVWARYDTLCTQMGVSPFQAAQMPVESLKEMWTVDYSQLKNKGSDVMITNDSDDPIVGEDAADFDKALNDRIGGARRAGKVATSQSKLRVLQLGRSTKELALWDGYKIKQRDLCTALQVDSALFNDPDSNKFSNRQEAIRSLYNECVIPLTKLITENKELISFIGYEIYCNTSEIEALQEAQAVRAEKAKSNISMVTDLNLSVKNGTITKDIAVKLLVSELQYAEEEARELIIEKVTEISDVADKANTLSAIVANKVLDSMTTNERRNLVGLPTVADGDVIPQQQSSGFGQF